MPTKIKSTNHRTVVMIAAVVIVGLIGVASWQLSKTKKTATTTAGTNQKQYSATGTPEAAKPNSTTPAATTPASTGSLAAPSGQLLNVQTVSLNSGPGLESVCQTIAYASCDIRLTQGSTTKYVGAQNTGSNGMVIFDWDAKKVGLTTGQWNIQAVVAQNNNTGVSHTETLTVQP